MLESTLFFFHLGARIFSRGKSLLVVGRVTSEEVSEGVLVGPMSLNCQAERCSILKNFPAAKKAGS